MRSRILSIGLLASALINSSLPAQKATTRPVTFVVNDQMGAVIAHAQIRLTPAPDPAPANTETDDQGRLSMNLKPGSYTLLVSNVGFSKFSQHIEIAAPEGSADTVLLVQVMLLVDPSIHGTAVYEADTLVFSDDRLQVPVTLSLAEFHALPHVSVTVHNAHADADETYSGVPLACCSRRSMRRSANICAATRWRATSSLQAWMDTPWCFPSPKPIPVFTAAKYW
jgi:hypothetical protein